MLAPHASNYRALSYICILSYKQVIITDINVHVVKMPPCYPFKAPRAINRALIIQLAILVPGAWAALIANDSGLAVPDISLYF